MRRRRAIKRRCARSPEWSRTWPRRGAEASLRRRGGAAVYALSVERRHAPAIRIGDDGPDFTAGTTEGTIHFDEWGGDKWASLFSHPKDFTPVCVTELGDMARLKAEFEQRNTR